MRDNANTAATFFPMSSCHYNLSSYNLRIGSKIIPAKAPSTVSEFFIEACKAVGSVSDINHCPSLNMFSYNKTINVANTETAAIMDQTSISNTFIDDFFSLYTSETTFNDLVINFDNLLKWLNIRKDSLKRTVNQSISRRVSIS
jgi:hypothetical protein